MILWGHREKVSMYRPGRDVSPEIKFACNLTMNIQHPECKKKKYLSHLACDILFSYHSRDALRTRGLNTWGCPCPKEARAESWERRHQHPWEALRWHPLQVRLVSWRCWNGTRTLLCKTEDAERTEARRLVWNLKKTSGLKFLWWTAQLDRQDTGGA